MGRNRKIFLRIEGNKEEYAYDLLFLENILSQPINPFSWEVEERRKLSKWISDECKKNPDKWGEEGSKRWVYLKSK